MSGRKITPAQEIDREVDMIVKIKPLQLGDDTPLHEQVFECKRWRKELWPMKDEKAMKEFLRNNLGIACSGPLVYAEDAGGRFDVTRLFIYVTEDETVRPVQILLHGQYEVFIMNDRGQTVDRFSN